jgi:hypothetical protein
MWTRCFFGNERIRNNGRDVFCAVRAGSIYRGLIVLLSQLRVATVRSEKLVAETRESSGTQRKGNIRRWKPLPRNG